MDIEKFLQFCGVKSRVSGKLFWKKGRQRFGAPFVDFERLMESREMGGTEDPYPLKNSSLDMSLYVDSNFGSDFYRAYGNWFDRTKLPSPRSVLDLGCGNGVLTCYYATQWPNAQIIGIDRCAPGIDRARELAQRLSLENVSFEQCEVGAYISTTEHKVDAIFSTHVMHELLGADAGRHPFSREPYWDIQSVVPGPQDNPAIETLSKLTKLVEGRNPIFVSVERIATPEGLWRYAQCIEAAGFRIIPSASGMVRANAVFGSEEFPALVAGLDQAASRRVSAAEVTALKAATLHLKEVDDAALALANSFNRDEVYFEAESNYRNGSGIYRVAVFRSGWVCVLHNRTDHGYETIEVSSILESGRMIQAAIAAVDERRSGTTTVSTITDAGHQALKRYLVEL